MATLNLDRLQKIGEKPQDTAYQEALATKRIEFIQSLKGQLSVENSVADQTVALYSMLLEEILLDELLEVHRELKTEPKTEQAEKKRKQPLPSSEKAGFAGPVLNGSPVPAIQQGPFKRIEVDIFGNVPAKPASDIVVCMQCGKPYSFHRFAKHLESCMGGGRQAARKGSARRTGTGSAGPSRLSP